MFGQNLSRQNAPIHPYQLTDAVVRTAGRDAVVIADGGETSSWMEMAALSGCSRQMK